MTDSRGLLVERYLSKCDNQLTDASPVVLQWLRSQPLDEPHITDRTLSLLYSHQAAAVDSHPSSNATNGLAAAADPCVPLWDLFSMIPLSNVSLENCGLSSSQLDAFLAVLTSPPSRSQYSLKTLLLRGNEMTDSLFQTILSIVKSHPFLTIVRVDSSPQYRVSELDQLCQLNHARAGRSSALLEQPNDSSKMNVSLNSQHRTNTLDGAATMSNHSFLSASSRFLANPRHLVEYPLPVAQYFTTIQNWLNMLYGRSMDKPLPDSMFFFILMNTLDLLSVATTSTEFFQQLKHMERHFVAWVEKQGSHRPQLTSSSAAAVSDGGDNNNQESLLLGVWERVVFAHCGSGTATSNTTVGIDPDIIRQQLHQLSEAVRPEHCAYCNESSVVDPTLARKLLYVLEQESIGLSSCFVVNTSHYLMRVLLSLMARCVQYDDDSLGLRAGYRHAPRFCSNSTSGASPCATKFARGILCGAKGLLFGSQQLSAYGRSHRDTANAVVRGQHSWCKGAVPFETVVGQAAYPSTVVANFPQNKQDEESEGLSSATSQPTEQSLKLVTQPRSPWNVVLSSASLLASFKFLIEKQTKGRITEDCLFQIVPQNPSARPAYPVRGLDIEALLPNVLRGSVVAHDGTVNHVFQPVLAVQFHSPLAKAGNHHDNSSAFTQMETYLNLHRYQSNGSDILFSFKARPSFFHSLTTTTVPNGKREIAVADVPMNDEPEKGGVSISVIIREAITRGSLRYLVASYCGVTLLLDERIIASNIEKYGAFAFVDCSLPQWATALRKHDPARLSSVTLPFELMESTVFCEIALWQLLKLPSLYPLPDQFGQRMVLQEGDQGDSALKCVTAVLEEFQRRGESPLRQVTIEQILQLIRWYRCGRVGQAVLFWSNESTALFASFIATAARKLFANHFYDVHPSLHAVQKRANINENSEDHNDDLYGYTAKWRLWMPSRTNSVTVVTSGRTIQSPSSPMSNAANILSHCGAIDLQYLQEATAFSQYPVPPRHRFFVLQLDEPLRVTHFTIQHARSTTPSIEGGIVIAIRASYSADGRQFTQVDHTVNLNDQTGSTTFSLGSIVGSLSFWMFTVAAIASNSGEILDLTSNPSDLSQSLPVITSIQVGYLPSVNERHLLFDYEGVPKGRLLDCFNGHTGYLSRLPEVHGVCSLKNSAVSLYHSDFGYLSGARCCLGGPVTTIIAQKKRLFAFRGDLVVECDRYSGQVVSSNGCATKWREHPVFSFLPEQFSRNIGGGFALTNDSNCLFVFNTSHFTVFNTETLQVRVPATHWTQISGRYVAEMNPNGIPVHSQLVKDDEDPYLAYELPFREVEWCVPDRHKSTAVNEEHLVIGFRGVALRWLFSLKEVGVAVLDSNKVAARTVPVEEILPSSAVHIHTTFILDAATTECRRELTAQTVEMTTNEGEKSCLQGIPLKELQRGVANAPFINCNEETQRLRSVLISFPQSVHIAALFALSDPVGAIASLYYFTGEEQHQQRVLVATSIQDHKGLLTFVARENVQSCVWEMVFQAPREATRLLGLRMFSTMKTGNSEEQQQSSKRCVSSLPTLQFRAHVDLSLESPSQYVSMNPAADVLVCLSVSPLTSLSTRTMATAPTRVSVIVEGITLGGSEVQLANFNVDQDTDHDTLHYVVPQSFKQIRCRLVDAPTSATAIQFTISWEALATQTHVARRASAVPKRFTSVTGEATSPRDILLAAAGDNNTTIDSTIDDDHVVPSAWTTRENQSYVVTFETARSGLHRLTATAYTKKSGVTLNFQPFDIFWQSLSGAWQFCATSSIGKGGRVDVSWSPVIAEPQPLRWKIVFSHEHFALRDVTFFSLETPLLIQTHGYKVTPGCDPLSLFYPLPLPCALLDSSEVESHLTTFTVELPYCYGLVAGVTVIGRFSSNRSQLSQVQMLSLSGETTLLWSGTPSTTAYWQPTAAHRLVFVGYDGVVERVVLHRSGPTMFTTAPNQPASSVRVLLQSGSFDSPVVTWPARIPLSVGSKLVFDVPQCSTPLLFNAVQLTLDKRVTFAIECADHKKGESYTMVRCATTSGKNKAEQFYWDGLIESCPFPTKWRLKCLSIDNDSDLPDCGIDVAFSWSSLFSRTASVDFPSVCGAIVSNATLKQAGSQPALRQRALIHLHSSDTSSRDAAVRISNLAPSEALASSSMSDETAVAAVDRRQSSVASQTTGFVYFLCDLKTGPQNFRQIAMCAETPRSFEVLIQRSTNGETFTTVALHQQHNQWSSTSWPDGGSFQYWRLLINCSIQPNAQRKQKRATQSFTSFTAEIDEKIAFQSITQQFQAFLKNIVWFVCPTQEQTSMSPAVTPSENIALRLARDVKRLLPMHSPVDHCSLPVGLDYPYDRDVVTTVVDPVEEMNTISLWRLLNGKPSPSSIRAATSAFDTLSATTPHLANPFHVFDKESTALFLSTFATSKSKEIELTDATVVDDMNRLTADPSVVIRGIVVGNSLKNVPAGSELCLILEWYAANFVSSQQLLRNRVIVTVMKPWNAVTAEFSLFHQFSTIVSTSLKHLFPDHQKLLTVVAMCAEPVVYGGNFPVLPMPRDAPSTCHLAHDIVFQPGVTVLSPQLSSDAVAAFFQANATLNGLQHLLFHLFGSQIVVAAHAGWNSSVVTMHFTGTSSLESIEPTGIHWTSARIEVVLDLSVAGSPSWSVQLAGSVVIPHLFGNKMIGAVANLLNEQTGTVADNFDVALCDRSLLDYATLLYLTVPTDKVDRQCSVSLPGLCGILCLRLISSRLVPSQKRLVVEKFRFFSELKLSHMWRVPVTLLPVVSKDSALVLTSTRCSISPEELISFVTSVMERTQPTKQNNTLNIASQPTELRPLLQVVRASTFHGAFYGTVLVGDVEPLLVWEGEGLWNGASSSICIHFRPLVDLSSRDQKLLTIFVQSHATFTQVEVSIDGKCQHLTRSTAASEGSGCQRSHLSLRSGHTEDFFSRKVCGTLLTFHSTEGWRGLDALLADWQHELSVLVPTWSVVVQKINASLLEGTEVIRLRVRGSVKGSPFDVLLHDVPPISTISVPELVSVLSQCIIVKLIPVS